MNEYPLSRHLMLHRWSNSSWHLMHADNSTHTRLVATLVAIGLAACVFTPCASAQDSPKVFAQIPSPPPSPPLPSPWVEAQKKKYSAAAGKIHTSVFVAPIDIRDAGLDRSSRSLMMALLTTALSKRYGVEAVNPFLIQRALGEGARKINSYELPEKASAAGAKLLVHVSAGHDKASNLLVTLRVSQVGANAGMRPLETSYKTPIAIDESPAQAFEARILPDILRQIGLPGKSPPIVNQAIKLPAFPATPAKALDAARASPIAESATFQLFGMLAPSRPERARERFFEQSLIALSGAPDTDPVVAVLKARALFYLHSRVAALAAMKKSPSPAATALEARINGNLPELQQATARVDNDFLRAFSEIELWSLKAIYRLPQANEPPASMLKLLDKKPEWSLLFWRRLQDEDSWSSVESLSIKTLLDRTVPLPGFELESVMRGKRTLEKDIDAEELSLSVFEHVNRAIASPQLIKGCSMTSRYCPEEGFLDLAEALAISNAAHSLNRAGVLQVYKPSTDALLKTYEKVLDGQPDFEYVKGLAILRSNEKSPQDPAVSKRWSDATNVAAYWERGQTRTAWDALRSLGLNAMPYNAEYADDIPFREYWDDNDYVRRGATGRNARNQELLRESSTAIEPALALLKALQGSEREAVVREMAARFHGHPERSSISVAGSPAPAGTTTAAAGDVDAKLAGFEAGRRERPDLWPNYFQAGRLLIEEKGAYKEAAAVFVSFPGFTKHEDYNPVALSNFSYEAGSMLFWRGELDGARKLYKVAADLDTGSAASMASRIRIDILDGRYSQALEGSLVRATRYEDAFAYRDYLAWLFAFGRKDEAWSAFMQLRSTFKDPEVWIAAQVGNRMERRSWKDLRDWLASEPIRTVEKAERFALIEAVMLNTVDRKPADDLPEFLKTLEGTPHTTFDGGMVMRRSADVEGASVSMGRSELRVKPPERTAPTPISSPLVAFARPYIDLRNGRFEAAATGFWEMAQTYPITGESPFESTWSYPLPYFAWASAKTGDKYKLEQYLDRRKISYSGRFDHYLAKAFFTGLRGETEESVRHLRKALDVRPFTGGRPIFTEYQWAEACEWLFDATGKEPYREMAITWAKTNQKTQPFFAWAYSMEAKLTRNAEDRTRALGFAMYLDPGSERVAGVPAAEKEKAAKWFKQHNPFGQGNAVPSSKLKTANR